MTHEKVIVEPCDGRIQMWRPASARGSMPGRDGLATSFTERYRRSSNAGWAIGGQPGGGQWRGSYS